MSIAQGLLGEWDHEMEGLRKELERVPDDRFDYRPHEKSGTLGWLANHLSTMPGWPEFMFQSEELDVAPDGGEPQGPPQVGTRDELLTAFEDNLAKGRAAIAAASDEAMMTPWALLMGGRELFRMPRIVALRTMVLNHMIHHRAQLGVYLRLLDIPLPSLYGPSADEDVM